MLKMAGPQVEQLCTMIEECNGLDKIEGLQNHDNIEIYKLAYDIIEQYFSGDVSKLETFLQSNKLFFFQPEDDTNLAPTTGEGEFNFDPSTNVPNEGFKF